MFVEDEAADQTLAGKGKSARTSRLSASAAHEINNPLDSLLNLLHLLETEATLTEKARHYLHRAQEEVHRISRIARETLTQHRISERPEMKNVAELLVATRFSADGHIPVYGESLRHVFSNLLLNAMEAMPQGGTIHARVSAAREWSAKKRRGVRVTVGAFPRSSPSQADRMTVSQRISAGLGCS